METVDCIGGTLGRARRDNELGEFNVEENGAGFRLHAAQSHILRHAGQIHGLEEDETVKFDVQSRKFQFSSFSAK